MEGISPKKVKTAGLQYTTSCAKQSFKVVLKLPLVEKHYFKMQEQR